MIPSLNQIARGQVLRDGVLVRFRCMIQDNLDKVLKHKQAGEMDLKYRRGLEGVSTSAMLSRDFYDVERFVAVSVPGEPLMPVSEALKPFYVAGVSDKRDRVDTKMDESEPKRARESVDNEEPPAMIPVCVEDDGAGEPSSGPVFPHPLSMSLVPEEVASRRISAVLNLCDMAVDFKLHEIVEVVGVVSKLLPEDCQGLPLCDYSIEVIDAIRPTRGEPEPMSHESATVARSALKTVLARLLGNDQVAAEYLLLQLVSSRVAGNEALPTLGSWALSLSNADQVDVSLLSRFVSSVVDGPSVSVPTSNSVLMTERFYPVRPAESDFTHPGVLQLPPNTTMILDERELSEGQVNALNVLAISRAVREQELMAVFGSSDVISFKLDCRFVIFNSGRNRSIFANTNPAYGVLGSSPFVAVELRPTRTTALTEADISLCEADLKAVQNYVRAARSLVGTITITEDVIGKFQNDWVESRKIDPAIPTEDIDAWATLLRIVAASRGAAETSMDDLASVLTLERERRQRLPAAKSESDTQSTSNDPVVTGA